MGLLVQIVCLAPLLLLAVDMVHLKEAVAKTVVVEVLGEPLTEETLALETHQAHPRHRETTEVTQ
jgi:hypothetical protein